MLVAFHTGSKRKHTIIENLNRPMEETKTTELEKKFQLIFDNVQIPYYEASLDGMILDVSPSIQKISLYKREDLIGMSMLDLYSDPSEREQLVATLIGEGEIIDHEIKAKDKDGSQKILSLCAKLIHDDSGNPDKIIGSIQDITRRKKAEQELQESEQRYRQLFESTSDIQVFIDTYGNILNSNLNFLEGIDYTEQELQSMKLQDLVPEKYLTGVDEFLAAIQKGQNQSGLMSVLNKNGQQFVLSYEASVVRDEEGKPTRLIAVRAKNVTSRIKAEQALRRNERLFYNFMDNYPYAVNIKEIGGRFIWGNKAWVEWVTRSKPVLEINGYADYTNTENAQLFDQEDEEVLQSGESRIFSSEMIKDGEKHIFERVKFPIKNEKGEITTRGSIFVDITEKDKDSVS